ncbi:hypothetical protein BH23ACT2_BH23ACT2_08880 [soil metagenome]
MLIWFAATSVVLVAVVFRSGAIDYRTVIVGSLLPWLEAPFGPGPLHSVVGAVVLLTLVMLATRRRRLVRRRLLGLPIGLMCHLVLDGSFTRTDVFWWPLTGTEISGQVPALSHVGLSLALEVAGIAVAVWAWRWFGLENPAARARFVSDGRLVAPS